MTEDRKHKFYYPERVLIVAAHADDIEFGVSGMVAKWTGGGTQVTYCIVTDNSSGSNEPDTDLDALVATRREEQINSAKAVGVDDVRFLNYKDGILEPTLELRRDITRLIRELKPQIVVTFDPTTLIAEGDFYVNHPDHVATGTAAMYATFPSAGSRPIFPELLAEGYEPHDVDHLYLMLSNNPTLTVDISDVIDLKLDTLRCHVSQLDDNDIEMVKKWNADAGEKAGVSYAESARVITFRMPDWEEDPETMQAEVSQA